MWRLGLRPRARLRRPPLPSPSGRSASRSYSGIHSCPSQSDRTTHRPGRTPVRCRHSAEQKERPVKLASTLMAAVTVLAASACAAFAIDLSGAGATFPYPIYAKWADAYKKETGVGLNYQSIGSGGGIKQIQNKTVTFGATDMPLKPEELKKAGLIQFPTVIGGDVPVVNLEGVKSADLRLDGDTLAKIFLGQITKWDDPAIKKLNPNAKLPSQAIVVVHRSDGSGTTSIWTDYLAKVSADWKAKVGSGTTVKWPVGVGAPGNAGVASTVKQVEGAIGYVELIYALANKLPAAPVKNSSGSYIVPSLTTVSNAAEGITYPESLAVSITNSPGA